MCPDDGAVDHLQSLGTSAPLFAGRVLVCPNDRRVDDDALSRGAEHQIKAVETATHTKALLEGLLFRSSNRRDYVFDRFDFARAADDAPSRDSP
jgi:hypothetical protein